MTHQEKINTLRNYDVFAALPQSVQEFLSVKAEELHISFQELKILTDMAADLEMWGTPGLPALWNEENTGHLKGRNRKQAVLDRTHRAYLELKENPPDYTSFTGGPAHVLPIEYRSLEHDGALLGRCPVAGVRTRCCNLQTLDAVQQCGFACSYCSIQSFYDEGRVYFIRNLREKLRELRLEPDQLYHIGTGQSSDSLMWGNREGLLDTLFEFASANPNVILELKTKSSNILYLLDHDIPPNVLTTWSLNTQTIIANEEHLTAPLQERLSAAAEVAGKGGLVGFHFHPIVRYRGWQEEYSQIYRHIQEHFRPSQTAMISIGTLTYIKPVIRLLRTQQFKSRILQMPLEDAAGKLSYPFDVKLELFTHAYRSFSREWHDGVFFYMCMEDPRLWQPVFGREYTSNEEFENDMKNSYMEKIKALRPVR